MLCLTWCSTSRFCIEFIMFLLCPTPEAFETLSEHLQKTVKIVKCNEYIDSM